MKVLLIATSLLISSAYADHHEENFDQVKQQITTNIDQKISALQSHKSCVQTAKAKEDLKKCRESHKTAMKKLHEENKGERKSMKEKMQAKWKEMKGKKGKKEGKEEKEE